MKFLQQSAHGRTFNVKTSDGTGIAQLFLYLFVLFESLHLMNIHTEAPVLFHEFRCLIDMANATLAQDVEFFKADIFRHVHIKLGGRKTFGRHIKRCKIGRAHV